jgi:hypothetical protein
MAGDLALFLSYLLFGLWVGSKLAVRARLMSNVPPMIGDSLHFALGVFTSRLDAPFAFLVSWLYIMYEAFDYIEKRDTVSKDIATYLAGVAAGLGFTTWGL